MAIENYRSYMDRITVSDSLHEKLTALPGHAPALRKAPLWLRTGALAACAVLVVGAGAYAVWQLTKGGMPTGAMESSSMAIGEAGSIDLAPEDPDGTEPGMKTMGGYETHETRAGVPIVCYHILPWIDYGTRETVAASSLDWDFPPESIRLQMTREQIAALLGGEEALTTHLDWDAYELTGRAGWNAGDCALIGAYIQGYEGPMDHWEFSVWAGKLPPTCLELGGSVTQEIWNVSVTAEKMDSEDGGGERSVCFMKGDYGYRFRIVATDADRAEQLVSRLVRRIIVDDGFYPANLTPEGDIHMPSEPQDTPAPSGGEGTDASTAASVPPGEWAENTPSNN